MAELVSISHGPMLVTRRVLELQTRPNRPEKGPRRPSQSASYRGPGENSAVLAYPRIATAPRFASPNSYFALAARARNTPLSYRN